jgi:hypothetical protein
LAFEQITAWHYNVWAWWITSPWISTICWQLLYSFISIKLSIKHGTLAYHKLELELTSLIGLTASFLNNSMVKLILKLWCNKCSAYTERPTPPLVEENPLLNRYMSRREQKSLSWILMRP